MQSLAIAYVLSGSASYVKAQFGGGDYGGHGNHDSGNARGDFNFYRNFFSDYHMMVTAHAVLATLAFALLFPVGGIMIRLASFPKLWLVHGVFQTLVYLLYTAAFAIGVYMAMNLRLLSNAHAVIGILLFVVLCFQPILGFAHHFAWRKYSCRVIWSHAHIWLGRIIVTLGIINGGLGLQLAESIHLESPRRGAVIGYSVAAAIVWLLYIISAVLGERKRRQPTKEAAAFSQKETVAWQRA